MTIQSPETLRDDVAYLRTLAEDGGKPTGAGGSMLVLAGTVFGIGSLLDAARLAGYLQFQTQYLWLACVALFMAIGIPLAIRLRRLPSARSPGNRAVSFAWSGVGYAIFTISAAAFVIGLRTGDGGHLVLFGPVVLALYGVAWTVDATMSARRWMTAVAAASYAGAILIAFVADRPALYMLAYGVALLGLATVPGLMLMRQDRAERA